MQEDLLHGAISCTDIVQYFLSNIQAQQHLNVFLSVYDKDALTQATIVDQKIKLGKAGKLAGLIVGIKDVLAYKDHPLQAASNMLDGFQSQFNATAVQRLLDEDVIIIGRQNCDEFAMGSSNENSAFGPVLHAIDNSRVPGGSSGGSAVAVMANMCHISLGSDTGGSVRQPAAFCGVLGLKPTYSRISRHGLVAFGSSFDCIGIFGNHLDDVALVLEHIAGADEYDSTVSQKTVPNYTAQLTQNQKFRIAYIPETIENPALQPEIKDAILNKLSQLKAAGHPVEPVDFPLMDYCLPTYYILATAEASANLSRYDGIRYGHKSEQVGDLTTLYKQSRTEGFGAEVKRRILLGTYILSANYYDTYYAKAQKVRRLIREQTKTLFEKYDVLIMPTTPTTAFALGKNTKDPMAMYLADIYSVHANVAGIPGISVPCGVDHQGLPIGLQLLADDFEEGKLLAFADFLMKLKGDA
jgi:aspartyl-tRNA(Asn)/glutamyl-tRNA(Gln) amidotransferase subunit A